MDINKTIDYPYLPEGKKILFVPPENVWMNEAKKMADANSACSWWPTGAVVVKNNEIIGRGANSGNFQPLCPRVEHNCPTGEGYHFCNALCSQDGHSEVTSIMYAIKNGNDPTGADLYLFGHWWCCKNCWDAIIKNGIANVYLLENAHLFFVREKRLALMDEVKNKIQQGKSVSREEIIWIIE
ncbi:hypothetical protein KKC32_03915 [Patescibacteria group bacterium]|nr:hypothetical protein [Patescibacteria group bacterium]